MQHEVSAQRMEEKSCRLFQAADVVLVKQSFCRTTQQLERRFFLAMGATFLETTKVLKQLHHLLCDLNHRKEAIAQT